MGMVVPVWVPFETNMAFLLTSFSFIDETTINDINSVIKNWKRS